MFQDVAELREFYTSALGQFVQRTLRRALRQLWPDVKGQRVLAIGYGTPLLRPFLGEAERVMAFMPAMQGVVPWPREGPNCTILADETRLPLQDVSVDCVILLHTIENAPHLNALMQEVWRVLASHGRLLVVAPNRTGFWSHIDSTPFGQGTAFSSRQIRQLLRDHLFIPEREARALFWPPAQSSFWRSIAYAWEEIGRRWFGAFAGVHLIEASKQLYAPTGHRARVRAPLLSPAKARPAGFTRNPKQSQGENPT